MNAESSPPAVDSAEPSAISNEVQANLGRAAKSWVPGPDGVSGHYRPRDWSLFLFFRILPRAEWLAAGARLEEWKAEHNAEPSLDGKRDPKSRALFREAMFDFAHSESTGAGATKQLMQDQSDNPEGPPVDAPAPGFREWMRVLVEAEPEDLLEHLESSFKSTHGMLPDLAAAEGSTKSAGLLAKLCRLLGWDSSDDSAEQDKSLGQFIQGFQGNYLGGLERFRSRLTRPGKGPHTSALVRLIHYELLRQAAPAFAREDRKGAVPALRSARCEEERLRRADSFDQAPILMAFTYSGLKALKIDERTLSSFPDAFREGMAARAARLRDTGPSAPENWEGRFGLKNIHGYFASGSNLGASTSMPESFWRSVRREIATFNGRAGCKGDWLQAWIQATFRPLGLQIVHIELGQDPYEVECDGSAEPVHPRVEHFGYRDGLSQPFVDLNLGDTLPGGGTPSRRGSWSPVAPGEIFLGCPDETGKTHEFPANKDLRQGSTFLVFRKLEQDVYGFRAFLEQQRPNDRRARRKLGAQFVGRWKNGTALVRSPEGPRAVDGKAEEVLNDFRYAADDPYGIKCPLSAHIRRANPRDTGGRNDVRHHRILRRGMSFGGPLLRERAPDDGTRRGMLFVAANARIDVQFEVVQGEWLNGGEFLGQAGLGRCPVTGRQDNAGGFFLETGATAPISGLPDFVTTRGGDYFFAPGMCALKGICRGDPFEPEDSLFGGYSMGDTTTPELFGMPRIAAYRDRFFEPGDPEERVIRLGIPGSDEVVAFVGRHEDVTEVLSNKTFNPPKPPTPNVVFSVSPYLEAGVLLSRGDVFLVGTDSYGATSRKRKALMEVLRLGWETWEGWLGGPANLDKKLRETARARLSMALRRTAGARHLDLVDDLAAPASYAVIDQLFGIPGPAWLTELAGSLPFSRQHVGELPPDWIAAFKGERPTDPPFTTMQIWLAIVTAGLLGNRENQRALQALSRQAGSEALSHIDLRLLEWRALAGTGGRRTLAEAFVYNEQHPQIRSKFWEHYGGTTTNPPPPGWEMYYYRDVAILLLEILGSTLTIIPLTFASVMTYLLEANIDLPGLLRKVRTRNNVTQIIYEAERLNPNSPVRLRRCQWSTKIGKQPIEERDLVAALIAVANLDEKAFHKPYVFSLKGYGLPTGPPRDRNKYLLFGVTPKNPNDPDDPNGKHCWGRDRVALPLLQECVYAAGRLQGLRRVAGARGEPQKLVQVTIGLAARFDRILKAQPLAGSRGHATRP
jgi:deferrochelatase/peroxidase EfeB